MFAVDVFKDIQAGRDVRGASESALGFLPNPREVGLGVTRQIKGDDRPAGRRGDIGRECVYSLAI